MYGLPLGPLNGNHSFRKYSKTDARLSNYTTTGARHQDQLPGLPVVRRGTTCFRTTPSPGFHKRQLAQWHCDSFAAWCVLCMKTRCPLGLQVPKPAIIATDKS
jgi:hypothetical protein